MEPIKQVQRPSLQFKAPLPFVGQKRFFLKHFRSVINENIPNDGAGWTIIDVFGGSGLLSNNAKHLKPKATVIFNDFDNYSARLNSATQSNQLRRLLFDVLEHYPRQTHIDKNTKRQIVDIISKFAGFIDMRVLSSWLLFGGNNADNLTELFSKHMYNCIRKTDYSIPDDYLKGVQVVTESYETLIPKYLDKPNVLLILDPPYVNTQQGSYKQDAYFGMVQFLRLMSYVRPPYIFFSSTRSELLAYLELIKETDSVAHKRLGGFEKISMNARINKNATYEDHMIYRFNNNK